ncbi:hypothetical protein N9L68_05345 [bacterium]|nr:hypothetical protein [bacterium]
MEEPMRATAKRDEGVTPAPKAKPQQISMNTVALCSNKCGMHTAKGFKQYMLPDLSLL